MIIFLKSFDTSIFGLPPERLKIPHIVVGVKGSILGALQILNDIADIWPR